MKLCIGYPGHTCTAPVRSNNGNAKRCPECAFRMDRIQKTEWQNRQREADHDESDGTFWRIVSAPDMDAWGSDSQFLRSEIALMLRADDVTGERGLLDGTVLERVNNPDDMRIVSGGRLRVYVGKVKTNVILTLCQNGLKY